MVAFKFFLSWVVKGLSRHVNQTKQTICSFAHVSLIKHNLMNLKAWIYNRIMNHSALLLCQLLNVSVNDWNAHKSQNIKHGQKFTAAEKLICVARMFWSNFSVPGWAENFNCAVVTCSVLLFSIRLMCKELQTQCSFFVLLFNFFFIFSQIDSLRTDEKLSPHRELILCKFATTSGSWRSWKKNRLSFNKVHYSLKTRWLLLTLRLWRFFVADHGIHH